MKNIHCLGPRGTFSDIAALVLAEEIGGAEVVLEANPVDIAKSVRGDELGLLPYNNLIDGLVQLHLDLMYKHNLRIIGAHRLPLVYAAGMNPTANDLGILPENQNRDTVVIKTHPKAYAQCQGYISETYQKPLKVSFQPKDSTAAGAEEIGKKGGEGIAIAHPEALKMYGLRVMGLENGALSIDDSARAGDEINYTDFLLLGDNACKGEPYQENAEYDSIITLVPSADKPGQLLRIEEILYKNGINQQAIHTRNAKDRHGNKIPGKAKMFYIEVEAHSESHAMADTLNELTDFLKNGNPNVDPVRVLGSYRRLPDI